MADPNPDLNTEAEFKNQASDTLPKQATEGFLFFNVMPKVQDQEHIVAPVLTVEKGLPSPAGPASGKKSLPSFIANHKFYVIMALLLLIGGPAVYIIINKIGSGPAADTFLVKNAAPAPGQNATTTAQLAGSDFTTPAEWRAKYFPGCTDAAICGDKADPDKDGLSNLDENKLNTDPNNADSDQDGIADGDEVNIFGSDPLKSHTAGNPKYSDLDNIKGGYDPRVGTKKLTADQIAAIRAKMAQFGLHQPTQTTVGGFILSIYGFTDPQMQKNGTASGTPDSTATTTTVSGFDQSVAAKQDRDAQRSNSIKNLEMALLAYKDDNKSFPGANNFKDMYAVVKPYVKIATNPQDPINQDPFVYGYVGTGNGTDFTLSFYSEVAAQIIKKHAADALKDQATEQAAIMDDRRKNDLETLRGALLVYSNKNVAGNQDYVFPTVEKYKTALVPDFISQIPKDPKTNTDYEYQVSATFNTFTLKTPLDNPPTGTTGYLCNQDECKNY